MDKFKVQTALINLRDARRKWRIAKREFDTDVEFVMARLLHEAAINYLSVDEVAHRSGFSELAIRRMMRDSGLDPKKSKHLLANSAAKALNENAELLAVKPGEMDLTSPLAYLPMGEQLKQQLTDARVHRVTEVPETDLNADEFEAVEIAAAMYGTTNSDLIPLINTLLAGRGKDALREAADDAEEFCHLNHTDGPPCTCFTVIKNLRNRIAAMA